MEGDKLKCLGSERDCIEKKCTQYMQFYSVDNNGKRTEFWRCAIVQIPYLLIELNSNLKVNK